MGKYIDFVVHEQADPEQTGKHILQHLTVNRLRAKKPCVILVVGDSGEGKSFTALKIAEVVNNYYNVDTLKTINDFIVYTPLEYTQKLDNILHNNEKRQDIKNLRVLMIDEAREVVRSHLWHSFINQAISDCNAMSRRIKPLVIIVVTQFVKDIDSAVRRTITYYGKCARPLTGSTRFDLFRVWKDDHDLERPKLRKRKVKGYIISKQKQYSLYTPEFEVHLPDKKIINAYEHQNFEAKSKILRKKLEDMLKMLEKDIGHEFDKVHALVNHYINNPDNLRLIITRRYNKIRVKKEFKQMHDLTNIEVSEFEKLILEKLAQKGLAVEQ